MVVVYRSTEVQYEHKVSVKARTPASLRTDAEGAPEGVLTNPVSYALQ